MTYSPEGPVRVVERSGGGVKFGVPSEFQFTISAMVYLVESQAPAEFASALYTNQVSVSSGLKKKLETCQYMCIDNQVRKHLGNTIE